MIDLANATVVDEALIQEVTRRIVEVFHPEKVILFGSHARGEARPDSDLDLIVVMKSDKPFWSRPLEISDLFLRRRFGLDLLVYTPEEYERDRQIIGRLASMIDCDARTLYAVH